MKHWWKCIALPGIVVPNHTLCQFKPECLEYLMPDSASGGWLKVFQESKGTHSATVHEKPDVSVTEREKRMK